MDEYEPDEYELEGYQLIHDPVECVCLLGGRGSCRAANGVGGSAGASPSQFRYHQPERLSGSAGGLQNGVNGNIVGESLERTLRPELTDTILR